MNGRPGGPGGSLRLLASCMVINSRSITRADPSETYFNRIWDDVEVDCQEQQNRRQNKQ